ncbi:MAG TPA: PilZ domain-containing protein [Candidatus Aquilonibacter sp.]
MPAPSNRRLFYRQAMYQRINLRVSGLRAPVPTTLIDLSGGGGMIQSRTMLRPHIAVEFDLPREGMPHLRLAGRIRKVSYIPGERTFRYAIEFETLTDESREALLRFVIEEQRRTISLARRGDEGKPLISTRIQEQRAHRRIELNMPVRYTVTDSPGVFEATAVDVSTGGLRIVAEHMLRQEWVVTLRFTLPSDVLRAVPHLKGAHRSTAPFKELRVDARALPGIKQSRSRYIQSLVWVHPDPQVTEEIDRFVQASQIALLRRA